MEELATNGFSQALGWQTFFACMVGVFTVDTFRSAQSAIAKGRFGLFEGEAGTVLFEVCASSQPCHSSLHQELGDVFRTQQHETIFNEIVNCCLEISGAKP